MEDFFKAGQPPKGWAKTWAGWDRKPALQPGGIKKKKTPGPSAGGRGGRAGTGLASGSEAGPFPRMFATGERRICHPW